MEDVPVEALGVLISAARQRGLGPWEPLEWTLETEEGEVFQVQVVRTA